MGEQKTCGEVNRWLNRHSERCLLVELSLHVELRGNGF